MQLPSVLTRSLSYFSVQDRTSMVIHLETSLFPEANAFECSSEIAKRARSTLRLKKLVSLPSCLGSMASNCLSRETIHVAALNIMLGMKNVESGPI